jgi:hypothetical protein
MSQNFRMQQLCDRVPAGPYADKVKGAISAASEAASAFAARRSELSRSGKLTDAGLREQLTSDLQKTFAPKLNNARRPVRALRQRLAALRAEIMPRQPDPSNIVAELQRQELRSYLLDLEKPADRVKLAMSDARFAEAALGGPLPLSGLPETVYNELLNAHLQAEHGDKLAEAEAIAEALEAGEAALQMAEADMRRAYGDPRGFDTVVASVRAVPWLRRSGDQVLCVRPDQGVARPATAEDLVDGRYFEDFTEYAAANGLGDGTARANGAGEPMRAA